VADSESAVFKAICLPAALGQVTHFSKEKWLLSAGGKTDGIPTVQA